jgi:hypothetical protein
LEWLTYQIELKIEKKMIEMLKIEKKMIEMLKI